MAQIAVKLDQDTLALLDESAAFRSLSREDMLKQAINDAAEYDRYSRVKIMRGMQDISEGRIYSSEEVDMRAERRISRLLRESSGKS